MYSFDQDSGFPCFKGGPRTILNLRKRFHLSLTEEVSQLIFRFFIISRGFLLWSHDGCSNAYRWCSHWSVAAWMPGALGSTTTTRECWMGFYDVLQEHRALDSFRNQFPRVLEQILGTNRSVWGWSSVLSPPALAWARKNQGNGAVCLASCMQGVSIKVEKVYSHRQLGS